MSRRSMTRDIHESIRLLLGKNVKILLKAPVKLELKGGDKTENRILVFTAHRLFLMTAKVPARIDHHFHYLDLRGIESRRPSHVAFTFLATSGGVMGGHHGGGGGHHHSEKTVTYSFRPNVESAPNAGEGTVDEMLSVLVSAIKRVFPGVPVERIIGKVALEPPGQRQTVQALLAWSPPDMKLVGPCGGFSAQYACMCDYYSLPFREEVAWDVDTIYFSHDSHEMCLQDFEHLDHRDQLCIISSLEHNTWFTRLKASANSAKLPSDVCERILQVAAKSSSLQELHMPGVGARWEFVARLAQSVAHNSSSALVSFDLSCNFVEDKGLNHLSGVLSKQHSRGLKHVNLSYCSVTNKGLSGFASALSSARINSTTLTYLNLAGNTIKDDSQALCSFLAQPNVVAILDLSATDTPLDGLFGALVRGCVTALTHLNLSRNPFSSSKKTKEIPAAFKQFFASTLVLQYLNVSHCKFPPEAVKHLLLGLACNESTTNVELNLSNNALGAVGAQVIESCVGGVKCVSRLDLSDNSIEAEMAGVMQGVARSHSILSLNVSKNMTSAKPKHLPAVMESIVQLIQDEETVLQKLNLSDCKLKGEINNVINALGSNQCLQHLDISGNMMGDMGARLLAKALQINTRLRIVNLDRNGITLQGYTDITYALQSNYAMRHIPFPTYDMQPFVKTHPERVDGIVHRMQELLQRNASPHRFRNTAQAFRLTQGFLLSSTQQILDRVSAQTQDNIDALAKLNPEVADSEDAELGRGMIQDAENCKHLLSALHEVTARGPEVDQKLKSLSLELGNFMTSHVHQNVDAMLSCAEKQCPRIMGGRQQQQQQSLEDLGDDAGGGAGGGGRKTELRAACLRKCQISQEFVSGLVMDQLGLEIHNKINELNLIIANHISDRVIDEVIEGLTSQSKVLVSEVGSLRKKRSLTPDSALSVPIGAGGVGKGRSSSVSESLENETTSLAGGDAISQKSESSPLSTPQTSKRKTLQGRKLRPKSVTDSHGRRQQQEDKEFSSSSSVVSELSQAKNAKNGPEEDGDDVPELPSTSALQHLGKARPRRAKRHAPTRGSVVQSQQQQQQQQQSGEDDDGGLAKFYTSPANSSFSPGSTPSGSPTATANNSATSNISSSSVRGVRGSKEDLSSSSSLTPTAASQRKAPSPDLERRSPLPPKADRAGKAAGSGLSCLASAAVDEDHGATTTTTTSLLKPSPEKRALSPSLHSITDMFSASRHREKQSPKPENKVAAASTPPAPAGISPFASRKTDSELISATSKRASYGASAEDERSASSSSALSPSDEAGKRTPEGVVKRVGVGHGGNLDLMAEMKEKRASMVPKTSSSAEAETSSPSKTASSEEQQRSAFGQVKLRSTGLAGSLTSPATEFPGKSDDDDDKSGGGSIVGLRASRFSSSLGGTSSASRQSPPPTTSSGTAAATSTSSSATSASTVPSSSHNNSSSAPMAADTGGGSIMYPKPKPMPKPRPNRPWSIVGVDRKTGDVTTVASSGDSSSGVGRTKKGVAATSSLSTSTTSSSSSTAASSAASAAALAAASRKSSVRDMINNMNKGGGDGGSGSGAGGGGAGGGGLSPSPAPRKGNSLPRGTTPPSAASLDEPAATNAASRSPNLSKQSSSPVQTKRRTGAESTSDDPRILKLDDDFAYDEALDV